MHFTKVALVGAPLIGLAVARPDASVIATPDELPTLPVNPRLPGHMAPGPRIPGEFGHGPVVNPRLDGVDGPDFPQGFGPLTQNDKRTSLPTPSIDPAITFSGVQMPLEPGVSGPFRIPLELGPGPVVNTGPGGIDDLKFPHGSRTCPANQKREAAPEPSNISPEIVAGLAPLETAAAIIGADEVAESAANKSKGFAEARELIHAKEGSC